MFRNRSYQTHACAVYGTGGAALRQSQVTADRNFGKRLKMAGAGRMLRKFLISCIDLKTSDRR
eukprot:9472502-Pyramimonas_sp.AAC.2